MSLCDSLQCSGIIRRFVSGQCFGCRCTAHTVGFQPHDVAAGRLLRIIPILVVAADFHRVVDGWYRIGDHLQDTGAVHDMPRVRVNGGLERIETLVEGEARFRILSDLPYVFLDSAQHPLVDLCLPEKALAEQKRPEVIPVGEAVFSYIGTCGRMLTETEKSGDIDRPAAVIMKEWHTSGRQQGLYILNRLNQCPAAEDE